MVWERAVRRDDVDIRSLRDPKVCIRFHNSLLSNLCFVMFPRVFIAACVHFCVEPFALALPLCCGGNSAMAIRWPACFK